MPINFGKLSTENVLQANRPFDITPIIFKKFPDQAPFIAMMAASGKLKTTDPRFAWFNRGDRTVSTPANGSITDVATALVVDDASIFLPGDMAVVIDVVTGVYGEQIRITNVVTGTNTLTIVRNDPTGLTGTTPNAVINDNDIIFRIGSAHEEGSVLPDTLSQRLVEEFNFTQIFRESSIYTRTFLNTRMDAGQQNNEIQTRRMEKNEEFMREMENRFIWGERGIEGAGSTNPNRKTGGLQHFINQAVAAGIDNTKDAGGVLTEAEFETFLEEDGFNFGSDEKWAFCSAKVIAVLNTFARNRIQLENTPNKFGLNILSWISPMGVLRIIRHRQFNTGRFQNAMLIVDPNQINIRHIGSAFITFKSNVGLESTDQFEDSWLAEAGLQVGVPETLALLFNVTSAG